MSSVATDHDAAGKFYHPNCSEKYPIDTNHPVYQYFNGSFMERQAIINDRKCNGILVFSDDERLTVISIPQAEASFRTKTVTIYGFLGTSCSNTVPVQLNQDILKDVLVLAEEPAEPYVGNLPTPDLVSRTETSDLTIHDNSVLTRVPTCIPLFGNHAITQGRLSNTAVLDSIKAYHPLCKLWLSAIEGALASEAINENAQLLSTSIVKPLENIADSGLITTKITSLLDVDDTDFPIEELQERRQTIVKTNRSEYYIHHPHLCNPDDEKHTNPSASIAPNDDDTAMLTTASMKKFDIEELTNRWVIFLAVADESNRTVNKPDLNPTLQAVTTTSKSTNRHTNTIRKALDAHTEKATRGTRDYLKRMIDMPYFNQITISQLLTLAFKTDPLDENSAYLDKELNFCCFLPPPYNNNDYQEMCKAGLDANLDDVVNQNEKFSQRKSTSLFINGRQSIIDDVAAGAANLINTCLFIADDEDNYGTPLIVVLCRRIADFITGREFRRWFHKHNSNAKWIAHTIVTMFHGLISGFAKLSSDIENIINAGNNVLPPFSQYAELIHEADAYIAAMKTGIKQSSLGHFASPPHSYQLFSNSTSKDKKKHEKTNDEPDAKRSRQDDTGYITFSGTSLAKANLPKLQDGKVLCKEYVICGKNCSQKGNCRWGLHLQYRDLFPQDKDKLDRWISNSRTLKWRSG